MTSLSDVYDGYSLAGTTAVVTGAASGIGRATARLLARRGASVALLDVNVDGARQVAGEIEVAGSTARAFEVDLSDVASIRSASAAVLEDFGDVHILVCSAGLLGGSFGVLDVPEELVLDAFQINVRANFVLAKLMVQRMIDRRVKGRVVLLSSSSAFRAAMSAPHYSTTKAAIAQLARSLAAEVGQFGITVNAVAPGPTNTPMTGGDRAALDETVRSGPLRNLMGYAAEPEDVAEVIAFLCAPASHTITAQVIHTSLGAIV